MYTRAIVPIPSDCTRARAVAETHATLLPADLPRTRAGSAAGFGLRAVRAAYLTRAARAARAAAA